jgi:hypothetical protein
MAKIFRYQKIISAITTHVLLEPDYGDSETRITELCELDGWTYVSIPDGLELPPQPENIGAMLTEIILDDELRIRIKNVSPHVQLINSRVVEKIRAQYSVEDEIKMLRLAPSAESAVYNDYVESCRAWGRSEKAKLGLD